ncbi:hypothetical protein FZ942_33230 [Azospirillum lipoferum]|uniref:Histidine--tRNA ligase n=1 Tax=Azospirillum lipoferum TaxID=193 RepID=A0A5A9G5F0_AZOLI|nr:hypothetical protein FZ942_33230 [Azospirillum lipoferum]
MSSIACGGRFTEAGFEEIILPSICEAETFLRKIGPDKEGQMWTFEDRGGRKVCLIPEVTGMIQKLWREEWAIARGRKEPRRLFYAQRCYRYERPQRGRYREFTQFGIEILNGDCAMDREEATGLLRACLDSFEGLEWVYSDGVKRGLSYYVEDGFEAECPALGAQKQIAGGGRYAEGIGWAIGIDRLMLGWRPELFD